MTKTINKICSLVIFIGLLLAASQSSSQPQKVTWEDLKALEELKQIEIPKNSWKTLYGGNFGSSLDAYIYVSVCSPKNRLNEYVKSAKENYFKLDSTIYYPELFNQIEVKIANMMVLAGNAEKNQLTSIERVLILFSDDEVIEPDSTKFEQADLQNSYGANYVNIDATCFFPLKYFDGKKDIKFIVFHNNGRKFERTLKLEDIMKME